ncbi:hypothetical protein BAY59_11260 [Prauserella coralliicola]|nr:hypothetical protein BAY59_11260 [Prauserella coralliicola]
MACPRRRTDSDWRATHIGPFREAIAAELEPPIRTSDTRFKIGLNVRTAVAVLSGLAQEAIQR